MSPDAESRVICLLEKQDGAIDRLVELHHAHELKDERRHAEVMALSIRVDALESEAEGTGRHEIVNLRSRHDFWARTFVAALIAGGAAVLTWLLGGKQ